MLSEINQLVYDVLWGTPERPTLGGVALNSLPMGAQKQAFIAERAVETFAIAVVLRTQCRQYWIFARNALPFSRLATEMLNVLRVISVLHDLYQLYTISIMPGYPVKSVFRQRSIHSSER